MANYPQSAVSYGQTNANVTALQNFLISQGMVIPAGATGYFGDQTKAALAKWQSSVGITPSTPGYGTNWGPQSIAKASAISSTTTPINTSPNTGIDASKIILKNSTTSIPSGLTNVPATQIPTFFPTPIPTPAPINTVIPPSPQPAPPTGLSTQNAVLSGQHKPIDKAVLTSITGNLGPGMSNDPNQVKALQQALVNAGYMTAAQMATGPGTYGPQTTAAVATWQNENGIPTAGNAGFFGPVSKSFISTGEIPDPNAPIIDPKISKGENVSVTDPYVIPPGIVSENTANSGIMQLPDEAVNGIIPQIKPGTPEYQDAMDKISTAYFDVLQQQMNAKTEQEQQSAQYNWQTLKKTIETNLNIKLSDDAFQAWDQVQGLKNQFGGQNLEGSGFQSEATDAYLRKMRVADANSRTGAATEEDKTQMDYYKKFATPQQVQAFIASNPDKAKAWGLVPSDAVRNAMSLSALKAKYPDKTDQEIQSYIATVLDENGNYRSNLYQNYMTGNNPGASEGNTSIKYNPDGSIASETVTPSDWGMLDINKAKEQFQSDSVMNANLNADIANRKLIAENSTNIKSTDPASDTVSGTSAGTRFNSITPDASTPAATSGTPTLTNPINAPVVVVPPQLTTTSVPVPASAPVVPPAPVIPVPAPVVPAPTPKKTYNTLYDYYTGTSGAYPAWNSAQRMADAKKAGISNYTGTGPQNNQLLAFLQK
jgi:hypothetical protein